MMTSCVPASDLMLGKFIETEEQLSISHSQATQGTGLTFQNKAKL